MPRKDPTVGINHNDVQSSSIRSIGYDPDTQELHVNFHGTGRYIYHGVTPEKHEALMMAGSKGNYLHQNIKNAHEFTKL